MRALARLTSSLLHATYNSARRTWMDREGECLSSGFTKYLVDCVLQSKKKTLFGAQKTLFLGAAEFAKYFSEAKWFFQYNRGTGRGECLSLGG